MGISEWVAVARKGLGSYRHVLCDSCGAETLVSGVLGFCSNCEGVVGYETRTMQGSSPSLFSQLEGIRTAILGNDFERASTIYDELIKERSSPQLLYAKGLMGIQHSNYVASQIRYDGEGFMERNAELRHQAALLVSEGKKLIMKSLSMSEAEAREAPNVYALYRIILCNLKMADLRSAEMNLKKINGLDKKEALASYARVAFDVQGSRYKEAAKELEKLVKTKTPPANAFYYAAFVAFKTGDRRGAEQIIKASGSLIEEQKKANILEAIREVESVR
jgi:tetratricopeptide (TPR) repeat protein